MGHNDHLGPLEFPCVRGDDCLCQNTVAHWGDVCADCQAQDHFLSKDG